MTTKKRRWRPQFSLRFLLVATLGVAVVLGWLGSEVRQASRLLHMADELDAVGASAEFGKVTILGVELDDAWVSWLTHFPMGEALFRDVVAISLTEGFEGDDPNKAIELAGTVGSINEVECFFITLTSESMTRLSQFPSLRTLQITECGLPEGEPTGLSRFASLTELRLDGVQISDELLRDALRIERLEALELYGCEHLSPEVIQQIGNCATLRRLSIELCYQIWDEDVTYLSNLPQLEELCLSPVTDAACAQISKLKNLRCLEIGGPSPNIIENPGISDLGIAQLSPLKEQLSVIDIDGVDASDDVIRRLVSPACIRELNIYDTQHTAGILEFLGTCRQLEFLRLGPSATPSEVRDLKSKLPNCRIILYGGNGAKLLDL